MSKGPKFEPNPKKNFGIKPEPTAPRPPAPPSRKAPKKD